MLIVDAVISIRNYIDAVRMERYDFGDPAFSIAMLTMIHAALFAAACLHLNARSLTARKLSFGAIFARGDGQRPTAAMRAGCAFVDVSRLLMSAAVTIGSAFFAHVVVLRRSNRELGFMMSGDAEPASSWATCVESSDWVSACANLEVLSPTSIAYYTAAAENFAAGFSFTESYGTMPSPMPSAALDGGDEDPWLVPSPMPSAAPNEGDEEGEDPWLEHVGFLRGWVDEGAWSRSVYFPTGHRPASTEEQRPWWVLD